MQFTDEWLVPTLEPLLPGDAFQALRTADGGPVSLWETAVQRKLATDGQVLSAIAARFRFPIADLTAMDPAVKAAIPEQLVRKFNVLPLRVTDAYLEVATASPFDLDAEKTLAFATGREVRLFLGSPARIREKLDELYKNEDVVSKLLEGIGSNFEVKEVTEEEETAVSAEEASQRPIIRLVDMMLADGDHEPGERHPRRARRGRRRRPLPNRRRAAPGDEDSARRRHSARSRASRSCRASTSPTGCARRTGASRVSVNGEPVDLRVSTLPASLGEKVVIRILSTKGDDPLARWRSACSKTRTR